MLKKWWGYSLFAKRIMNQSSKDNGWTVLKAKRWTLLKPKSEGSYSPAMSETELARLALALGMSLEEFRMRLERELRKGKRMMGIQCQDGILVHPSALALAVSEIVRKETTVRKKTSLG